MSALSACEIVGRGWCVVALAAPPCVRRASGTVLAFPACRLIQSACFQSGVPPTFTSGVPLNLKSVINSEFFVTCVCIRSSLAVVSANLLSMCAIRSPLSEIRRLFSPNSPSSAVVLDSVRLLLVPIWFRNAANSAFVVLISPVSSPRKASTSGVTNQTVPVMTPPPNARTRVTMAATTVAGSFTRVINTLHVFLSGVLVSSVI